MALTLASVLAHHGINGVHPTRPSITTPDTLTDNAREAGIIRVCLTCGSVAGVPAGTPEAHRTATRDSIDWEEAGCCTDDGSEITILL